MRNTVCQPQKLVEPDIPLKELRKERGINASSLKLDDMTTILANHDNFRNAQWLQEKGHTALYLLSIVN